ncbi:hypothetical protein PENSPDRAFT_690365 [Peniophora sp. CONT]|nr:hypothetical protein PENSPDRAFT_690365 [Peniophora sp. CONT]
MIDEVGCLEVYHVCEFMNIFVPGTFECFDMRHSASHIMDSSLEEVADEAPPGTDPAKALREAYKAALAYLMQWFPDAARLFEAEIQTELDERCRQYKAKKETEPVRAASESDWS